MPRKKQGGAWDDSFSDSTRPAAGELAVGSTTVLNVPAGFKFNAGIGNTSVGGGTCAGLTGSLVVTATTAT